MGARFRGTYDLLADRLVPFAREGKNQPDATAMDGLDDPRLAAMLGAESAAALREEAAMARELSPAFDLATYRSGNQTPVFWGSALRNFGVRQLLDGLVDLAPSPRPQPTEEREVSPTEEAVTGFVFKIQANMDPRHRDRVAFLRLASGHFRRGMKLFHVRTGKTLTAHAPLLFLAREREVSEEAFGGDIIGLPNHGNLRIGDALTEGEALHFTGIPSFAPELLKRIRTEDPMRVKHLGRALVQLAEEGAAQAFKSYLGNEWNVGVAGPLQFEVLAERIRSEYDVAVRFESTSVHAARWVEADDPRLMKRFRDANEHALAEDHDGMPVFLARNAWHLDRTQQDWPEVRFLKVKEQVH